MINANERAFDRELRRVMEIGDNDWNEKPTKQKANADRRLSDDRVERHYQQVEAARIARKVKARKKLLKLLDRKTLESLSHRESPWLADKATLESDVLVRWPATEIDEAIAKIMDDAR